MRHLYLIGFRGSGKTSVAAGLAQRSGLDWIDTDQIIERSAGRTIKEIFETNGEPEFRRLESECIARVASGAAPMIISLGGGAILADRNREVLKGGNVVWLQASAATLAERISKDSGSKANRPRLTGASHLLQEVEDLLKIRTPIYKSCANHIVDTEGRSLDEICEEIMLWLKQSATTTQLINPVNSARENCDQ